MTVYWLTFRLHDDIKRPQRYAALLEAVESVSIANEKWDEPTSFVAFDSGQDVDQISAVLKAAIDPTKDLFLIRNMESRSARICGRIVDKKIFDLMVSNGKTYLTVVK